MSKTPTAATILEVEATTKMGPAEKAARQRIAELEGALRDIIEVADSFKAEYGIAMGDWDTARALNKARELVR